MVKVVSDSVHRQLTDDDTSPARPPAKSLPGGHFFALTPHRTAPEGAASKHHRKSSLLARDRRGDLFLAFPPASPPRHTPQSCSQTRVRVIRRTNVPSRRRRRGPAQEIRLTSVTLPPDAFRAHVVRPAVVFGTRGPAPVLLRLPARPPRQRPPRRVGELLRSALRAI